MEFINLSFVVTYKWCRYGKVYKYGIFVGLWLKREMSQNIGN